MRSIGLGEPPRDCRTEPRRERSCGSARATCSARRAGGHCSRDCQDAYVVRQTRDGLELRSFKGHAGNLGLGCELRRIEEPAKRDRELLVEGAGEARR